VTLVIQEDSIAMFIHIHNRESIAPDCLADVAPVAVILDAGNSLVCCVNEICFHVGLLVVEHFDEFISLALPYKPAHLVDVDDLFVLKPDGRELAHFCHWFKVIHAGDFKRGFCFARLAKY
jgi:hypothetical protein